MKILTMSVFCVDIYKTLGRVCVGGNSLNFAVQCLRSGNKDVYALGAIGSDEYGTLVKDYLAHKGIDLSHVYTLEGSTASNKIYINDQGDRYFLPDSWDNGVYGIFRASDNDLEFIKSMDIVATTYHDPNFEAVKAIKNKRFKLVVDFLDSRDFDLMREYSPHIDICFISGDTNTVEKIKSLSEEIDTLFVVTLGAKGSLALQKGSKYYMEALGVDKVVDTTGCGDAYQAAFSLSYFEHGDISEAMKDGSVAAMNVLKHLGGVE